MHTFKGVPFAAAPTGVTRYLAPRPVEPWAGIRDALTIGPTPPQPVVDPPMDAFYPIVPGADYLNLNIWSRELGAVRQPVMVWIYGGGFDGGSNVIYDCSRFARDGVVCVAINYRLGAEGFLCLEDGIANVGLLDQISALEWVHANIAAFGGDPDNITVFGQSSGAVSIAALMSTPSTRGLLIGFVNVAWDGADHAFLLDTKVRPEHRHRGIAASAPNSSTTPVMRRGV
ncbi:carboxylesterase family protein [Nocardia sp. NPDC049707]|uniref:carboxylesterase family protein n=1 Tax=Nocardia sp. NPDC049707 TaxID=3154735 RepID=UPI0034268602